MKSSKLKHNSLLKNTNFIIGLVMVSIILILFIVGLFYLPYDPNKIIVDEQLLLPSAKHLLGTDDLGRDILSRLMVGTRTSFLIGGSVVVIGLLLGTTIGGVAGYYGGIIDTIIMKIIDVQMSFPGILIALMVIAIFGSSTINIILALSIMALPKFARMARSGFIKYKEADFVKASKCRGASDLRIMVCHILPNIASISFATASLNFATAIVSEAGLSYIGLGTSLSTASFGKMLSDAQKCMLQAPHYVFIPIIAITLLVMGFHLIGDGLQESSQS